MGGPFDMGKSDGAGSKQNLPRHIERMNMGTEKPKMKKSGDGNNLPWGGQPKEQAKAYMSGLPKNKGSMLSKTGERSGKGGKALQGHSKTINAKSQKIK